MLLVLLQEAGVPAALVLAFSVVGQQGQELLVAAVVKIKVH